MPRSVLSNNARVLCVGQRVIGLGPARLLASERLDHRFDDSSSSATKVAAIEGYGAASNVPGVTC